MAVPHSISRVLSKQSILRSCITNIGRPTRIPHQPWRTMTTTHPRPLAVAAEEHQQHDAFTSSAPQAEEADAELKGFEGEASSETPHIPWYLQQTAPTPIVDHPMAARQVIPPLPISPPDILDPLLQHISISLGLDNLTLLDLRALDPPPALGANLLMLIATARSEKHLHVSADRLCRWLRTDHDLSPYADGLLGRNELKLKLRRKAKRSRMMSGGATLDTTKSDLEEGIRTGWVCVNIGRVEGGELPESEEMVQRAEGGVVGFGGRVKGARIVVQMLTEEKREEVDLEKLWGGIISRARKGQGDAQATLVEKTDVDADMVEVMDVGDAEAKQEELEWQETRLAL